MNRYYLLILFLCLGVSNGLFSQNLLEILEEEQQDLPDFAIATFKMTRIAIGHSVETRKSGTLELMSTNRFWNTPNPQSQSFFADKWSSRFGLDYAIMDNLTFGIGGTTYDGLFDAFLKYRIATQRNAKGGFPLSITLLQASSYNSNAFPEGSQSFLNRLNFTSQILIAKKITSDFSIQLSPTYINKGIRNYDDPKNHFAIGLGARYKLGGHLSVVSEYYYNVNPKNSYKTYGPFAIGANWELGDLMLQFLLTNTYYIADDTFITGTRYNFNFKNPNLNFGFNAVYVIHFKNSLEN